MEETELTIEDDQRKKSEQDIDQQCINNFLGEAGNEMSGRDILLQERERFRKRENLDCW